MNKFKIPRKNLLLIFLGFFSFAINFYYANFGVYKIDTFAFFDTAYNILIDRHPFKDVWITTGPLVDYLQAFFFKIFGLNWTSYVIHASFMNVIISILLFFTLNELKLNYYLSFFYAICFSILCYPISGTPFAYIHSYILALMSILVFVLAIKKESKISFIILPILMFMAFFSMQTPSAYIILIILFLLIIYFFYNFDFNKIFFFLTGCGIVILTFLTYLIIFEIPLINIIQQYILFPLTIAENRITGNEMAHITIFERLTFRNLLGHFKFINLLLILLIVLSYYNYLHKQKNFLNKNDIIINYLLFFSTVALIFNQLITSNQTYIFSIIPFLGAFLHVNLRKMDLNSKKIIYPILILVAFSTIKYHIEYNVNRKFMDLKGIDLKKSVDANLIDKKFKNLMWITPQFPNEPKKEINLILEALDHIKKENKSKMVITEYQFFSFILEKNLNIPNRWYTPDNNSYPRENHKYFKYYLNHFSQNIKKNKIKLIYIVDSDLKIEWLPLAEANICYSTNMINEISSVFEIRDCN